MPIIKDEATFNHPSKVSRNDQFGIPFNSQRGALSSERIDQLVKSFPRIHDAVGRNFGFIISNLFRMIPQSLLKVGFRYFLGNQFDRLEKESLDGNGIDPQFFPQGVGYKEFAIEHQLDFAIRFVRNTLTYEDIKGYILTHKRYDIDVDNFKAVRALIDLPFFGRVEVALDKFLESTVSDNRIEQYQQLNTNLPKNQMDLLENKSLKDLDKMLTEQDGKSSLSQDYFNNAEEEIKLQTDEKLNITSTSKGIL